MPQEVLEVSARFMRDPVQILVKKEELTLEGIRQFYINVTKEEWKFDTLADLYDTISVTQTVIFCNTRRKVYSLLLHFLVKQITSLQVEILSDLLVSKNFTVSSMHGDMDQENRDLILREFRQGASRILITTDLLARGIDVQQVSLVINYDIPSNRENYIHRCVFLLYNQF